MKPIGDWQLAWIQMSGPAIRCSRYSPSCPLHEEGLKITQMVAAVENQLAHAQRKADVRSLLEEWGKVDWEEIWMDLLRKVNLNMKFLLEKRNYKNQEVQCLPAGCYTGLAVGVDTNVRTSNEVFKISPFLPSS